MKEILDEYWAQICSFVFGIIIVLLVIVEIALPMSKKMVELSEKSGNKFGTAVGYLTGISEADVSGVVQEAKEEALRNPEVELSDYTAFTKMGNLEVLVAGISLDDFHTIGEKYTALYLIKADVVFSVDLTQAEIGWNEEKAWLTLLVPEPTVSVSIDESQIEKVAEWQKTKNSGSAEEGYEKFLNSIKEIKNTAPETVKNNDALMSSAREAAQIQIKYLARQIYGESVQILVDFQ